MRRFLQTNGGENVESMFVDPVTTCLHAPKVRSTDVVTQDLTVTGRTNLCTLFVSGNIIVPSPVAQNSAATRQYVDLGRCVAGVGLSKVGTSMNVESHQPGIKSLGVLEGLQVQGSAVFAKATVHGEISLASATVHEKLIADSIDAFNLNINREAKLEKATIGLGGISVNGGVSVKEAVTVEGPLQVGNTIVQTLKGAVGLGETFTIVPLPAGKTLASIACLISAAEEMAVYMADCVPVTVTEFALCREFTNSSDAITVSGSFVEPSSLRLTIHNSTKDTGEYTLRVTTLTLNATS